LVCFGSGIVWLSYRPYLGIDDAYIYFVYAKNLANGHGFVYNVGGERVEGFTSMLWVLICSLAYKLTALHFRQILMVINIFLVSFALFRLTDFVDRRFFKKTSWLPSFPSLCLLAILFIVKGYLDWTVLSLMETGLWSANLILFVVSLLELCYDKPRRYDSLSFSAGLFVLALTRPESLLLGIVFLAIRLLLYWYRQGSFAPALRASLLPAFTFAATFAGLIAFRLHYFGYPFPNTYYAKVSINSLDNAREGFIYFFKFLFVYPLYWIPLLMLIVSLWTRLKRLPAGWKTFLTFRDDELAQMVLVVISGIAFCIPMMVGGDHFSLFRIYQPFAPIFLLMLFNVDFIRKNIFDWQIQKLPGMHIPRLAWLIVLLPVVYLMNVPKYFVDASKVPYKVSLLNDFSFPYLYRQVSTELNGFFDFSPKPSIGRIWAGAYAFAYDGPTIDLMGLNDTLMAHANPVKVGLKNHASFDKPSFYKLHPDFVDGYFLTPAELRRFELPENTPDFDQKSFESGVLKGIFRDSAFIRQYQPVLIGRAPYQQCFFTYARVDYLDSLRQKNFQITTLQRKRD
jgi:hypothetical protein